MMVIYTQCMTLLLDIYSNTFNGHIFIAALFISAHPHLNVISGGLWQLLVEPRRIVEGAARVLCPTTSPIPLRGDAETCVTEVVPHHEWRRGRRPAETGRLVTRHGSARGKGPDVLSWAAVSEANTIHVVVLGARVG